ncbi:hypothetical protein ACWATR_38020 [Nostoc sp. UIC 10890]
MSSLETPLKWVKGRSQTFHGERSPYFYWSVYCACTTLSLSYWRSLIKMFRGKAY